MRGFAAFERRERGRATDARSLYTLNSFFRRYPTGEGDGQPWLQVQASIVQRLAYFNTFFTAVGHELEVP